MPSSSESPPYPSTPSNKALKLTRLSGCLLGGLTFGEDRAVEWPSPSSAVQLSASVGRLGREHA